jgi:hypothetical protein
MRHKMIPNPEKGERWMSGKPDPKIESGRVMFHSTMFKGGELD